MINDREVYWEFRAYDADWGYTATRHNNAEAARKAAKMSPLPSKYKRVFKIDPVHGEVEIMP